MTPELLTLDFWSLKAGLALFDQSGDRVALALQGLGPLDAVDDLAAGQQNRRQHQFLDGVRVRAGRVKDDDAGFGVVVAGDVYSCPRPRAPRPGARPD